MFQYFFHALCLQTVKFMQAFFREAVKWKSTSQISNSMYKVIFTVSPASQNELSKFDVLKL